MIAPLVIWRTGCCRLRRAAWASRARSREGAYSILTGIAARKSLETGRPVRIDRLVPGLPPPDFPKMPAW